MFVMSDVPKHIETSCTPSVRAVLFALCWVKFVEPGSLDLLDLLHPHPHPQSDPEFDMFDFQ